MAQLRQLFELELKNETTKNEYDQALKAEKSKERFIRARNDATGRLSQSLADAIADLRTAREAQLETRIADIKNKFHESSVQCREKVEEQFSEERTKLVALIENMEVTIKNTISEDQLEMERRIKKKQELLHMLAQPDTRKLLDEDLISKQKFRIERSKIVHQSNVSAIYVATSGDQTCYCKVSILHRWSIRHRLDFFKNGGRLARYLSGLNTPYFAKVIDVLATDTKIYTFLEPFPSTRTLHSYLESLYLACKRNAPKDASGLLPYHSGIKKAEMVNVLSQVVKAMLYLDNLFVAHMALVHSNITIAPPEPSSLSSVKLLITGLSRPIVYYSAKEDRHITAKGLDTAVDPTLDPIDHLPPECFEESFIASSVDVYSIGVLLYALLRLRSPFSKNVAKVIAAKKASSVRLHLDKSEAEHDGLSSLVAALTHPQTGKRLLIDDVLSFPYLK